jgi:HSP20 family protein
MQEDPAMNTITRTTDDARSTTLWDPFAGFAEMRRQMDELMAAAFGSGRYGGLWQPLTEVHEGERDYTITIEVPGLEEKDITVEVDRNVLSVRGERGGSDGDGKRKEKEGRGTGGQRWYGSFVRSLTLPANVDASRITANIDKGLLSIVLPKQPQEPRMRIAVTPGKADASAATGGNAQAADAGVHAAATASAELPVRARS